MALDLLPQLPVGVITVVMISAFVRDPHYIGKHKTGGVDMWGIGFLALGFGMLQVVLDTGQRKDWSAALRFACGRRCASSAWLPW